MTDGPHHPLPNDSGNLPEDLRRTLRDLYTPPGIGGEGMPTRRDAELFAAVRRLPAPARRGRWRFAVGSGLAAAVALAATLYWAAPRHEADHAPLYTRTGDIRDAYALARELKHSSDGKKDPAPAWWDANGDGRIDAADVDALALAAVQLAPGPSAGGAR
jgi:hypothetical protein